jgi:phosphate transport system permease protein
MFYALILLCLMGLVVWLSYYLGRLMRVGGTFRGGYYLGLLGVTFCVPVLVAVLLWRWDVSIFLLKFLGDGEVLLPGVNEDILEIWLYSKVIAGSGVGMLPGVDEVMLADLESRLLGLYGLVSVVGGVLLVVLGFCGVLGGMRRLYLGKEALVLSEGLVLKLLRCGSVVAIATSFLIVFSLVFESWKFFRYVSLGDFFLGLHWEPQLLFESEGEVEKEVFGILPVLWGTLAIAMIAMMIAIPIGLLSAIYLNGYAGVRVRSWVKPILELLAGIPTIVYGFVAVLVVAPFFHRWGEQLGFSSEPNNALAAGVVMGMMIVPFVSSFADDALNEVSLSVKYASYALGATRGETMMRVMLPAAFPGIASGVLLAASRAIGETMIVVMAAGLVAKFSWSPFDGLTTITVQIVALLVGDTSFDGPKTLSAFALGLTLFFLTLILNVLAFWIMKRYREPLV